MKSALHDWRRWLAAALLTSATALDVRAATLYVWSESATPASPYDSWSTAASTIQDAVDAAVAGDIVLVTNGVYAVGGRAVSNSETNRVVIQKAITVRSVNGPDVTIIKGGPATGGGGGIRCVYLGEGAVLDGLTLTGAQTLGAGGGVLCPAEFAGLTTNAVVTNCVISGNTANSGGGVAGGSVYSSLIVGNWASYYGGGAVASVLTNCRLLENTAEYSGGGVFECGPVRNTVFSGNVALRVSGGGAGGATALFNCTITGNSAGMQGGGIDEAVLGYNCVVLHNQAPVGAEYSTNGNGSLSYSCTRPLPPGAGNIDQEPQLASATHLQPTSPCIGAGSSAYASGVDIDGELWGVPPCIGTDQVVPGPALGSLSVVIRPESSLKVAGVALQFRGQIEGKTSGSQWDFGDGTTLTNLDYEPFVSHAWSLPGTYLVKLTAFNADYPAGVVATSTVIVVEGRHYVNRASPSPMPPYNSWTTAARTIDDAIVVAVPGALIAVTNGVYNMGGRVAEDSLTRVVIDKALTVRSVNGPEATVIQGAPDTRCSYVGSGAILSGFTLTLGSASGGGGVYGEYDGTVSNCFIIDNRADRGVGQGGGVYGVRVVNSRIERNTAVNGGGTAFSTVSNCLLADNTATGEGGGAFASSLYNCTVVANQAGVRAGGVDYGAVYNSIVYFNSSPTNLNYFNSGCAYSCTTPLPAGEGNITNEPALASVLHLGSTSPCIGAGSSLYARGVDLDGEAWLAPPCIGADQVVPGNLAGPLSVAILAEHTRLADGHETTFRAIVEGRVSQHVWDFGDGSRATNMLFVTHAWASAGQYEVRLIAFNDTTPEGVATSIIVEVVSAPAFYVNVASTNPVYPYVTWEAAATNIQQAIDASGSGKRIWVTNGVYETGSRLVDGFTNRVVADRPVRLESVNGPAVTVIRGGTNVRSVYLGANAILSGFTVSDGAIHQSGDNYAYGGGIWAAPDAVVTNCWIEGNQAEPFGGGIFGGTLYRCRLDNNFGGYGGGAYSSVLFDCSLTGNRAYAYPGAGGGAANSTLYRCTLIGNVAFGPVAAYGGGADGSKLYNCLLKANGASNGGGAANAELYHCTVVDNYAGGGRFGNAGGGTYRCTNWNTIVYHNQDPYLLTPPQPSWKNDYQSTFYFSCTTPLPTNGLANTDLEPGFADRLAGDFRLALGSPCIDTGTTLSPPVSTDLNLDPRPLDGNRDGLAVPDMGAYESSTNAAALFRITVAAPGPPVTVSFLTWTNRLYSLESCLDLNHPAWTAVPGQTDIPGTDNLLSLVDANSSTAAYYRVSVRLP